MKSPLIFLKMNGAVAFTLNVDEEDTGTVHAKACHKIGLKRDQVKLVLSDGIADATRPSCCSTLLPRPSPTVAAELLRATASDVMRAGKPSRSACAFNYLKWR